MKVINIGWKCYQHQGLGRIMIILSRRKLLCCVISTWKEASFLSLCFPQCPVKDINNYLLKKITIIYMSPCYITMHCTMI